MDEFPSFHASIVELDPEEMIAAIEFGIAATIPNGTDSSLDTIQEEGIDAEGNSYLPSAPHPLFQASIAIVNYFKGEPNKAFSCL